VIDPIDPIRKRVLVRCDVERAFDLFTRGVGTWWPLETHSRRGEVDGARVERVEFPTDPGRPILEHLSTGDALPWGQLVEYERPHRVVIAWKPNANPNPPTELEVTFTPEGDSTLLDHSMVVYGSGLSDGNRHTHEDLPVVIVGSGGGALKTGRHIVYPQDTPMTNMFLTVLDRVGVRPEAIGDSTGRIEHLTDVSTSSL